MSVDAELLEQAEEVGRFKAIRDILSIVDLSIANAPTDIHFQCSQAIKENILAYKQNFQKTGK